jgi:DNA-binding NarL/FixJ family response regulator
MTTPTKKHQPAAVEKKKKKTAVEELEGPRVCPHCGAIVPSPVHRPARAMPEELTERQMAVLRMVALGYTAQQIGDALEISRRTAEFHRGALMNKLGLRSTSELTMYALANRLVNLS